MIKKTTAIVAVVLFVILFTAGSVTAALALRSTTTVEDNEINDEYITINTFGKYTDFLANAQFDTVVTSGGVTYTPHEDGSWAGYSLISKETHVSVASTNVDNDSYNLEVSVDKFVPVAGLTYTLAAIYEVNGQTMRTIASITSESESVDGKYTWTLTSLNYGDDYSIALYISGEMASPNPSVGFTNHEGNEPGSVFTFTAINVTA